MLRRGAVMVSNLAGLWSYEELDLYGSSDTWLQKECDRWWMLVYLYKGHDEMDGNWVHIGMHGERSAELDYAVFGSLATVCTLQANLAARYSWAADLKPLNLGDFRRYERSVIERLPYQCRYQHSWPAVKEMVAYTREIHGRALQHDRSPEAPGVEQVSRPLRSRDRGARGLDKVL